jgi:alcohol dehydrogenase class IV
MDDPSSVSATWTYPTTVLFGAGGLRKAGRAASGAGMRRPLIVTDPAVAALPMTGRLAGILRDGGLEPGLFTEVKGNPTGGNVEAGMAVVRAGKHDGVVALGGGSTLDCAKAIAFMLPQSRPLWDFQDIGDNWKAAASEGILPIVAIPTTAGTGSEVGRAAVITDEETHGKKIIFHPAMLPRVAILDPELTVGLPPALTAGTGMDALAHCLEAYCATGFHPMSEGIAVEGARLVREALPRAFFEGGDVAARGMMLVASAMGAVAFQKGLGAIHSLSHPLGALYDVHHGTLNAVVMPYVLMHNRPAIEAKIVRLAAWLGLNNPSFPGFLDWVMALRSELGLPNTLGELGVPDDRVPELAAMALQDPTAAGNPVPLSEASLRELYERAFDGRLE